MSEGWLLRCCSYDAVLALTGFTKENCMGLFEILGLQLGSLQNVMKKALHSMLYFVCEQKDIVRLMRHFLFSSDDSSLEIQAVEVEILASGHGKASDHLNLIPLLNMEYLKTLDTSYIRQTLRYVLLIIIAADMTPSNRA